MKNIVIAALSAYILAGLNIWEIKPAWLGVMLFGFAFVIVQSIDWKLQELKERRAIVEKNGLVVYCLIFNRNLHTACRKGISERRI